MGLVIERWRDVVGREGEYQVSDLGNVRSQTRTIFMPSRWGTVRPYYLKGRILRPCLVKGYFSVQLGENCRKYVHTVVLEAFVGPRPNGQECRHLDGNRLNNTPLNLSWGTKSENMRDMFDRHGGREDTRLSPEVAFEIRKLLREGSRIKDISASMSVSESCISAVKAGRAW